MRVVVVADTHLRVRGRLPAPLVAEIAVASALLHAGDIVEADVLDELCELAPVDAPVHAVAGNNDRGLIGTLPEVVEVELAGVQVAMVHDAGPAAGRPARLQRRFPSARLIVFGHSHVPWVGALPGGALVFNPGSPTQRRRQPRPSYGVLELAGGTVVRHDLRLL